MAECFFGAETAAEVRYWIAMVGQGRAGQGRAGQSRAGQERKGRQADRYHKVVEKDDEHHSETEINGIRKNVQHVERTGTVTVNF